MRTLYELVYGHVPIAQEYDRSEVDLEHSRWLDARRSILLETGPSARDADMPPLYMRTRQVPERKKTDLKLTSGEYTLRLSDDWPEAVFGDDDPMVGWMRA